MRISEAIKLFRFRYGFLVFIIVALSFLIRLQVGHELLLVDPNVSNPSTLTDMATYYNLATEVLNGAYHGVFKYQPFYYVVFLPGIFFLFGKSIFAVIIVQSLLGTLTVLFSALTAENLFGKKASVVTALLLCLCSPLCFYSSFLLIVTLQAFWISLLLYLSILAISKKSYLYWFLTAIVLSCSILTRGNMWLFLPGLCFFLIYSYLRYYKHSKVLKSFCILVTFIACLLLPQIYFIHHNTVQTGKLTGPSTDADAVLSFGNTTESPPAGNDPDLGIPGIVQPSISQEYWLATKENDTIINKIWNFIKSEPLVYTELTFRKALLFWDHREIPNNVNINFEYTLSPTLQLFCLITSGILILLGIPGFIISIPSMNRAKYLLIGYFLLCYWISIFIFYILARFRVPVLPILAVYSGGFINYILFDNNRKTKQFKRIIISILLLALSAFLTFFSYDFYRYNIESKIIEKIKPFGTKVALNNKTFIIDNGPLVFGDWRSRELKKGDTILKQFIIPDKLVYLHKQILFSMPLYGSKHSEILLNINGKNYYLKFNNPQNKYFTFEIQSNYSNFNNIDTILNIKIKVLQISGNLLYETDHQRNYGRTFINGQQQDSELVCKLILLEKNQGAEK